MGATTLERATARSRSRPTRDETTGKKPGRRRRTSGQRLEEPGGHDLGGQDLGYWQDLVDSAGDLVQSVRPDGTFLYVNRAWRETLGYPPEALAGLRFEDVVHPDCHAPCRELFGAALEGRGFGGAEIVLVARSGRQVVAEWSGVCRFERGEPVAVQSILRDITERRRADQALRESEARFRLLADSAPVLVWMSGLDKGCDYFNKAWLDFTGRTFEQELGAGWTEGVHPDDLERCLAIYTGEFDARRPFRMEYRLRRRGGDYRWILDTGVPRKSPDGAFSGYIGSCVDITERKQTEEALRESERRFRELARHAPVGIYLMDARGGCLFVNERWCAIAGMSAREAWGNGWERALHPEDRGRVLRDWQQATAHGREMGAEFRFQAPGGRITWLHGMATPLRDDRGEVEGYVGMLLDITERRRADEERRLHEAQLQHVQKLESLGVLAGGIAHDFNNLLTSMLGYSSLALMHLPVESVACPLLQEIEQAARRAADLTQQMLAYSGKGKFLVQKVNLESLVHEMTKLLETVVAKKADLRIDLEPAFLEGDVAQIRQIVLNLVTNASEALEDEVGVIHLRTGQRRFDSASLRSPYAPRDLPAGDYAFLEVEDDGCGMSPETLARIFDPFFTTKFTGRGLGLAAVLGIVRGHHGAIQLSSTPRQGTCFQVYFPAVTEKAAPRPDLLAVAHRGQGTVLIVEDEAGVRKLARRVLEGAGFQVLESGDGLDGLDQLQRSGEQIALVLLDLVMPRLDGAEMLQELRRSQPDLPVLVMSGYSEQDVTARCQGLKASGFVQKPFHPQDLIGRICELLPPH